LFPKLYFKKKYISYFLSILLLATAVFYLRPFDRLAHNEHIRKPSLSFQSKPFTNSAEQQGAGDVRPGTQKNFPPGNEGNRNRGPHWDIISMILFILVITVSVTQVIIVRWQIAMEQASRAEADKANAELANLKSQINPHFLFNTLNNIYSQALMRDEKTPESIMKLSNIMRYVTDDANNDFVSLLSESNFISDYIELQRLRLGSKVSLDFAINGNLEEKVIAPLILITFIENVFKYGISNNEASTISIELRAYKESIVFFSRNKLFPSKHSLEGTGIGIINTKKRLEHLYPGKHSLIIKEEDGFFLVHLILQS
jgi:LytS/YehU family sensor histidine kinase